MIGFDSAEFSFIQRHLPSLPNFRRALNCGVASRLDSPAEFMAGSAWLAFYTASSPSEHGIHHLIQWDAAAIALAITVAVFRFRGWMVVVALVTVAFWLNRDLYRLLKKGGFRAAVCGFFLQQLYYLYSLFGLAAGVMIHFLRLLTRPLEAAVRRVGA